ncbi:MAG: hypothetical protein LIO71_00140 [Ruminococcus sp.]|nr:hypothetical protein [Ruminococcus sp.]
MAFDYKNFSSKMQQELHTNNNISNSNHSKVKNTDNTDNNTNDRNKVKTNISNPKLLFVESPLDITIKPCPRLNSFYKSATKMESFMNKCYNNTFKVDLKVHNSIYNEDEKILNSGIDSFFLHFDLEKVKDKTSLDKNVILSVEDITYDTSISDNCHLIYIGRVRYTHNLNDNKNFSYFNLKMRFELKIINNFEYNINKIEISISDLNSASELNIIGKFFDLCKGSIDRLTNSTKNNDFDGNLEEIRKFKNSTRSQSAYFSSSRHLKLVQDDVTIEYSIILRYYVQFNLIQCPICNKPIRNLGVPGIVLQAGKSNSEAQLTSNAIFEYIKLLTTKEHLTEEDTKLLQMIYGVIVSNMHNTEDNNIISHRLRLHTDDAGKSMITIQQQDDNDYHAKTYTYSTDDLKKYARIPLGELVNSFNEDNPEDMEIKPFTSKDFNKAKSFLDQFNINTCQNYNQDRYYNTGNQLYLLKYGRIAPKVDNFTNYLIHDTLITQLCDNCWNPLPKGFYNYDEVITLHYYGNPSAGKTVLLCSEYNEIEKYNDNITSQDRKIKLNMFNDTHLLDGADSTYCNNSYINKARTLKNGQYFIGTNALDIIPGKLSSLTVTIPEKSTNYDIMFNSYDMAGIKSSSRWNSDKNLVYVYSLLDDPLTLCENSLYDKLKNSFIAIKDNPRNYNIQLYLTKLDEYPYFIYKQIKELNSRWSKYAQNEDLDYVKSSMIYTLALLEILENCLKSDFKDRPIEEVISPKILETIQNITKIDSFEGLTYYQAHEKIVSIKQYDTNNTIDVIGNYLHGLDVIRDNYIKLRSFIGSLIDVITKNIVHNKYSVFCFRVYAVSSTGYSKLETENPAISKGILYNPEFIIDAQDILKHTTYEFVKDKRQCDYSNNLDSYITQLFNPESSISILSDDFLSSDIEYLSSLRVEKEITTNQQTDQQKVEKGMSIRDFVINRLYSDPLVYSDLYMDSLENAKDIINNSKEQESIKRLYLLYYNNNFNSESDSLVLD